jgi:hypothetical protein
MSIKPRFIKDGDFKDLTPFQNSKRIIAIILVFAGVFIWFVKIVF